MERAVEARNLGMDSRQSTGAILSIAATGILPMSSSDWLTAWNNDPGDSQAKRLAGIADVLNPVVCLWTWFPPPLRTIKPRPSRMPQNNSLAF